MKNACESQFMNFLEWIFPKKHTHHFYTQNTLRGFLTIDFYVVFIDVSFEVK